jgi:hypothetical protein
MNRPRHFFASGEAKRTKPLETRDRLMAPQEIFLSPSRIELRLPIYTQADNAHSKGVPHLRYKRAARQIDGVIMSLQANCRDINRHLITGILLTRVSARRLDSHDNLRQAFKHVVDAVCAWIVKGDDFEQSDRRTIGKFDKIIETGRLKCEYDQTVHHLNPKCHGIRIALYLATHCD